MAPSSCPAAVRSDRMRKRCCSPHPPCGLPAVKEPLLGLFGLQKRTASSLHASRWRPMRYSNSPGRSSLTISIRAWGTWPSENISPEVRWKYSSPVFQVKSWLWTSFWPRNWLRTLQDACFGPRFVEIHGRHHPGGMILAPLQAVAHAAVVP